MTTPDPGHHDDCPALSGGSCQCDLIERVDAAAFQRGKIAGLVNAEQAIRMMARGRSSVSATAKKTLLDAAKRVAELRTETTGDRPK